MSNYSEASRTQNKVVKELTIIMKEMKLERSNREGQGKTADFQKRGYDMQHSYQRTLRKRSSIEIHHRRF